MQFKTLEEIRDVVIQFARILGAEGHSSLPTYGESRDLAYPHIEVDERGYHLVIIEKGEEQSRLTTQDFNNLLYAVFEIVVSCLATDYELKHRIEGEDFRRQWFRKQIELMNQLSKAWGERLEKKLADILIRHPFDDFALMRCRLSQEIGWKKACEIYALPVE